MKDYIEAFYILVLENLNRNQLTEIDWERTISVSSAGIGPRVKKLSKEQKDALVKCGRGAPDFRSLQDFGSLALF